MSQPNQSDRDQDLGELDGEEEFVFPPAERKVVTQPVDLSVQTLVEQWKSNVLVLPEIQREYVWDNGKASRLIESLLLNIPVPVLYFAETPEAKYEIIDGHQRVHSIARFVSNEFPLASLGVLREYRGSRFHHLPEREQRFLRMRTLRAIIISIDSHPTMKFEIFERLNTGSISLNAQELRNSIYRGKFNKLLRELVTNANFRAIIGTKTPRKRMVDEELVLRFFALHDNLGTYRPPLKRLLNDFSDAQRMIDDIRLAEFRALFESTIARVRALIGENAFRLIDTTGKALESAVNRALFDAQMLSCSWVQSDLPVAEYRKRVQREVASLNNSPDFLDAIQRATGDRSRTLRRVRDIVDALKRAGVPMDVPFSLAK
jgi:hypothetical protein